MQDRHGIDLAEVPEGFRPFAAPLLDHADSAEGLTTLLGTLGPKAAPGEARDFALLLRRCLPATARMLRVTEVFLRPDYPLWYVGALNDRHRNAAYRRAIEALVTPDTLVLEAGTGSGLFAMMAARAGAAHVYTCEPDRNVAGLARQSIARNGLADRITVLECGYEDLRLGQHLPRRADIFLHEFVGAMFLAPGMAEMARWLRDHLLGPDAAFLPHRFATVAMPVGDTAPLGSIRVDDRVEGFDLSAVNLLAGAGVSLRGPVAVAQPLGPAITFGDYDMAAGGPVPHRDRRIAAPLTAEGTVTGFLQWVRHGFPDGSVYENSPDRACHWAPVFWPLPRPIAAVPGESLALRVRNTDTEIFVDLAD